MCDVNAFKQAAAKKIQKHLFLTEFEFLTEFVLAIHIFMIYNSLKT